MNGAFQPLSSAVSPRPIVVVDIETWGLDARPSAFALGVVYDKDGPHRFAELDQLRGYLTRPAYSGHAVYAHNGGKYDYLAIFGNYWRFFGPENVTMNGGSFISAKYVRNHHTTYFRDSLRIIPASLKKIGEKFGESKGETPSKFIPKDEGGTYEGFPIPLEESDWLYCEQDCKVLYGALNYFQERLGALRSTLPATAMAVFRRDFFPNGSSPIRVARREDLAFRPVNGGRTEAYRIGPCPLPNLTVDENSLYPAAMVSTAFPGPASLRETGPISVETLLGLLNEKEGFAECVVRHPDIPIGLLPHVSGSDKLAFPVGTFAGKWCFPELRLLTRNGGQILSVRGGVHGDRVASPFTGYVQKYYSLKRNASGFEREMAKLMLNALYGKFAEYHEQNQRWAESFNPDDLDLYGREFGTCSWEPISRTRDDGYYVFPSKDGGIAGHSVFSWAAYITSQARVINAERQLTLRRLGEVLYTDTDSYTMTALTGTTLTEDQLKPFLGEELGQLKIVRCETCKEPKQTPSIGGNKHYEYLCGCGRQTVLKGVKRGAKLNAKGNYEWRSIIGLKEAVRRNIVPGSPVVRERFPHAAYDKRIVLPDGTTKPIRLPLPPEPINLAVLMDLEGEAFGHGYNAGREIYLANKIVNREDVLRRARIRGPEYEKAVSRAYYRGVSDGQMSLLRGGKGPRSSLPQYRGFMDGANEYVNQ